MDFILTVAKCGAVDLVEGRLETLRMKRYTEEFQYPIISSRK